jgi:hypothetical protein
MKHYEHAETGWVIIVSLSAAFAFSLAAGALVKADPEQTIALVVTAVLLLALVNFYKLDVYVDEEFAGFSMGIGLIRKKFRLADIGSAEITRTSWISGWGIHYVGGGWLFNVNSLDAVALKLKNGRRCLIGTDDPQALQAAITMRLGPGVNSWKQ